MEKPYDDDRCDLDPNKICDNCCKCIDTGSDYRVVLADMLLDEQDAPGGEGTLWHGEHGEND